MAKKSKARAPASRETSDGANSAKREKRVASKLTLTLPLKRARKLAGDLHEAAGLRLWAEALDAATPGTREDLVKLQDAICDAGDLFKEARASNPRHLSLFMVACFERDGMPATPPQFVTATDEDEALAIWRATFEGKFGRRKPRADRVPERGERAGLHG